ncbi:protein translocase subunit SecF [Glaciibacter superstes]|uniref:protein translocase subunit SecF n=1 Tax=Glaciibacter superstes TaxID=501023 RepID=UPI0003B484A4|nr:protein translocase subunit SecF [Glaciibacter superstes]
MAAGFTNFGNHLYTGERSFDFIGKRRIWYVIASVMIIVSILIPIVKGGFNFGIEFRGGSQFQISSIAEQPTQQPAIDAVADIVPEAVARVTTVGDSGVRVQTDQLTDDQTRALTKELATTYDVPETEVATSFIGATWGADVTRQAIQGLVAFLLIAAVLMALYFRTWKMSVAALVSLLHDLIITAGVYALIGFEITPAAMIGFLTILGYSLYDTVVVFDKIRENTAEDASSTRRTFGESVNLAVNQTLVRSINTGIVAALPVASILFIGAFAFGADTLRDISVALLIGILVGTYSTIYIGAPLYAHFREGEPAIRKHDLRAQAAKTKAADSADAEAAEVTA